MSDLLNSASLVLIPSGYKEDTVYSVVPSDGSGDLSFTRASNGTRVNSAGLVEVCPWNLLPYSEDFLFGWPVQLGASITSNTTTAPNGTTTADTISFGTSGLSACYQSLTNSAGVFTMSLYAKCASGTQKFRFIVYNATDGQIDGSVFTVTTEWQRFEQIFTVTQPSNWYISNANDSVARSIFIWGAQLNIGSTAKPYFPTTDRLNVPRLTYQNGGGGCPSLLLEKQSTNLVTYSEQFTQTDWTASATITANTAVSPDGTQNADSVMESASNDFHIVGNLSPSSTNGTTYVFSFFAKPNGRNFTRVLFGNGAWPDSQSAYFNLLTGAVVVSASVTASMVDCGNGWYRCVAICTADANTTAIAYFGPARNMTDGYTTYSGSSSLGIYAWGAQLEASSYPTSYIPTTSASATRVADACFKTGASALIGQSEGTIFLDFVINGQSVLANAVNIYNNDYSATTISTVAITYSDGLITCQTFKGNGTFDAVTINASAYITGQRIKLAYRYKSGDFAVYVNGVQMGTSATTMTFNGTKSEIYLNALNVYYGYPDAVKYNEFVQFKTGLSNADLQALTS